eukprot:comp16806_c0_seq1/m.15202 comp16806_c0_seq1/g.15202  ORF comp16806_c0_seq1/g.15202 comp16806_c0_seq1/m.15202 type:complete len:300 (-) comp16806_c0_seq1:199-1098(-)
MGKKRGKGKAQKPWCWYCDRDFDDEKILIQHQKAKHFKCHVCSRKLNTAGGMVIHCMQVHKEKVTVVPNSKPGRESVDIEIFGMEGIPEADLDAKAEERGGEKRQKTENGTAAPAAPVITAVAAIPIFPPGVGMPPPPPGFMFPPGVVPGAPGVPLAPPFGLPPGFPPMPPGFVPPPGFPPMLPGMIPPPGAIPPGIPPGAPVPPGAPPVAPSAFPAYGPPGAPPPAFAAYQNATSTDGASIGPEKPKAEPVFEPDPELPPNFRKTLPEGAVLVYGVDNQSIEELRACRSKYRYKGLAA